MAFYKISNSHNRIEEIFSSPIIKDEYPFWVTSYGRTFPDASYHETCSNTPIFRLEYIISGKGYINTKGQSYTVTAGDTYLLHEGDDHNYYSDSNMPMDKVWVNLKGVLAQEIVKIYNLSDTVVFKNVNSYDLILQMHNICKNTKDPYILKNETSVHFLKIIQFLSENHIQYMNPENILFRKIRSYIDSNFLTGITMNSLAENIGFSPEYIIRLFKKEIGITPHQYIISQKMQLASSYLVSSDKTITQIADELMFYDSHHFSQTFTRYTGLRPSVYRKLHSASKKITP